MHKSLAKHGVEGFDCAVLAEFGSEEEALLEESAEIARHRVAGFDVMNHTAGGEGTSGLIHSEASRKRMRDNWTPRPESVELRKFRSDQMKGRPKSAATKQQISNSLKGHAVSQETRQALSDRYTGTHLSEQTRAKLSALWKEKAKDPVVRERLRSMAVKRWDAYRKAKGEKSRQPIGD